MGFTDYFIDKKGVLKPFEFIIFPFLEKPVTYVADTVVAPTVTWAAHKVEKVNAVADVALDGAAAVAGLVASTADELEHIVSGKSHFLLYIGIGIVVVVALPIVLKKVL